MPEVLHENGDKKKKKHKHKKHSSKSDHSEKSKKHKKHKHKKKESKSRSSSEEIITQTTQREITSETGTLLIKCNTSDTNTKSYTREVLIAPANDQSVKTTMSTHTLEVVSSESESEPAQEDCPSPEVTILDDEMNLDELMKQKELLQAHLGAYLSESSDAPTTPPINISIKSSPEIIMLDDLSNDEPSKSKQKNPTRHSSHTINDQRKDSKRKLSDSKKSSDDDKTRHSSSSKKTKKEEDLRSVLDREDRKKRIEREKRVLEREKEQREKRELERKKQREAEREREKEREKERDRERERRRSRERRMDREREPRHSLNRNNRDNDVRRRRDSSRDRSHNRHGNNHDKSHSKHYSSRNNRGKKDSDQYKVFKLIYYFDLVFYSYIPTQAPF